MTVRIEGHDCLLFGDRDRPILRVLSYRGKIRWLEFRLRRMLLGPLETLRPRHRGRTEDDLGSLLAFGTLLFDGVEALGSFYRGERGTKQTFSDFLHDFMGPAYAQHSDILRDDFRNGLAHGFAVKNGAFEFFTGAAVRCDPIAGIQIDPDSLFREFKRSVRAYLKRLRNEGSTSSIGRRFINRFDDVFGV